MSKKVFLQSPYRGWKKDDEIVILTSDPCPDHKFKSQIAVVKEVTTYAEITLDIADE